MNWLAKLSPDPPLDARPRYPLISAGWCSALLLLTAAIAIVWFYASLYEGEPTAPTFLTLATISAVLPWLGAIAGVRFRRPALGVVIGTLVSFTLWALLFYAHNAYCDPRDRINSDESFWRSAIAAHVAVGFALVLLSRQIHRRLLKIEQPAAGSILRAAAKEGAKTLAAAGLIIAFSLGGVFAMAIRPPERPAEYFAAIGIWIGFVVAGAILGAAFGTILAAWLAIFSPVQLDRPARVARWLPIRWSSFAMALLWIAVATTAGLYVKPYVLNYIAVDALFDDEAMQDWIRMGHARRGPFAKFGLHKVAVTIDSQAEVDLLRHVGRLIEPTAVLIRTRAVGNEQLAALAPLKKLKWLHLESDAISDAGLVHLQNLESLSLFSARRTRITGVGFERLRFLPAIDELGLSENPISDAGLKALARAYALGRLDLNDSQVTDEGLQALTACTNLRALNLANTRVRGDGLVHLPWLTELDLSGTQFDDESAKSLVALKHLLRLNVSRTAATDAAADNLGSLNLFMLDASQTKVGDRTVERMAHRPMIFHLDLSETNVTGNSAKHFAKYPKLYRLSLRKTRISDQIVAELAHSPILEMLDISETPVTDACIPHLKKMPNLTDVYLSGTKVTPAGKHAVWDILQD